MWKSLDISAFFNYFVHFLSSKYSILEKDDLEILGIVVYGTKDEISSFMDKPFIKAISLGGTIDNY